MLPRRAPAGLCCLLLGPVGLLAQVPEALRLDPAEAILLQPILGKRPLADSINAFPIPGGALLPLGELCSLLGFGIQVNAASGRAEGFFLSEKRRFVLDVKRGMAEVEGRPFPLYTFQALPVNQEIFVDARLLEAWFPIKVMVDAKASEIRITAREKLPVEAEWEREGKGGDLTRLGSADPSDRLAGTLWSCPYSFVDLPFIDLSAYWSKNQHGATAPPSLSTQLGGDFLWMSANAYLVRDANGSAKSSTFTLFREDPHAGLLGPLQATRVELGSLTQSASLDLAGSLPQGRGILVDNYPTSYRSKFATRTFQGTLEEGWSVELYQNKALLGYLRVGQEGRYIFKDVPLRFGLNQFKLVFHGPFGQFREESYRVDIANDQPPPGTLYYRLAGSRPIPTNQVPLTGTQSESRTNSLVEMEYGLTPYLAANTAVARIADIDGVLHTYDVVGLRSLFSHLSLQGNVAQDQVQGRAAGLAAQAILRTGYEYSTLTVDRSEYQRGFERTDFQSYGTTPQHLRAETLLQWDGTWMMKKTPVNLSLLRTERRFVEGGGNTTDSLRATFTYPTFTVAPALGRTVDLSRSGSANLDADVFVSFRKGEYDLQGALRAANSAGQTRFREWNVEANRILPSGLVYRVGLRGPDASFRNTELKFTLSKLSGPYGYGVDVQYAVVNGYTVGLRFQASFGREPRTCQWAHDGRSMASQGAVSLVAFKDNNGNKVMDPGEPILRGTQFAVSNGQVENVIDDPCVVFRTLLPRGQELAVRVVDASLEDASLQSTVAAYRIVPRPGKVMRLNFPVAAFGEISGTTRIRRAHKNEEYGGLELELLRADGERVKLFRSAYDGFFEVRNLPLGDYLLRVSPGETERLGIQSLPPRPFHIDHQRNVFEGQDLVVEPTGVAPELGATPKAASPPAPAQATSPGGTP